MKNIVSFVVFTLLLVVSLSAQKSGVTSVNGEYYPYMIDDCGDTLIVASLDEIGISSPRTFDNADDYRRYRRYRQYAIVVYPYAKRAIQAFREVEYATQDMKRRHQKHYARKLQQSLKDDFEEPLKKLSKTQGLILMRMVERELGTPVYYIIKDVRGGLTARYWTTMAGLFGHQLKEGYHEGEDPILDAVLDDFDVSYQVPEDWEPEKF